MAIYGLPMVEEGSIFIIAKKIRLKGLGKIMKTEQCCQRFFKYHI
jgi:hypothetical protein